MDITIPSTLLDSILQFNDFNLSPEYNKYLTYWPILLLGFILSFFTIPIIGKIAKRFGVTYKPGIKRLNKDFDNPEKAIHKVETPALGGLAVTIAILIAIAVLFRLDALTIPILLALGVLTIGSALDDIFNLPAKVQFLYQFLAAAIIALSIVDLTFISFFANDVLQLNMFTWSYRIFDFPLSFVFPGDLLLIAWILLCINAVKWVGGSPGLVESYSLVIFLLLFVIGIRTFSLFTSSISIFIAGSLIALLYFAYPSPKIMSGSSGKSVYGFLISLLALISGVKFSTTLMLLALPIIDALYVIVYRYIKYRPKNAFELMKINDTSHLHHQLLKLNLSGKQILLIETSVALAIGSLAILTTGALRYFALIFGIALVIAFIVFVNYKANQKDITKKSSPESKYSY
jgi:UDP-GlcNAc:undecaprenyl-phosphate/decaprenyl-phosphate GlcNAc-1-phosphate transferase